MAAAGLLQTASNSSRIDDHANHHAEVGAAHGAQKEGSTKAEITRGARARGGKAKIDRGAKGGEIARDAKESSAESTGEG